MKLSATAEDRSGAGSRSNPQTEPGRRQKTSATSRSVSSKKQSPTEKQHDSASPKGRSQGSSRGRNQALASASEDVKTAIESAGGPVENRDLTTEANCDSAASAGQSGKLVLPEAQKAFSEPFAIEEERNQPVSSAAVAEEAEHQADDSAAQAARSQSQALEADRPVPPESATTASAPGNSVQAGKNSTKCATAAAENPAVAATQLEEDSRR